MYVYVQHGTKNKDAGCICFRRPKKQFCSTLKNFSSNKRTFQDEITSVDQSENKVSAFTLEVMPFVRYYFGKPTGTRFYGQAGGGISTDLSRKDETKSLIGPSTTNKYNYTNKPISVSGEAMLGMNHFVSQNVAVNASLGYRYTSSKETTTYTNNAGVTSDPEKYISKGGAFIWNVGFTMFIPSSNDEQEYNFCNYKLKISDYK